MTKVYCIDCKYRISTLGSPVCKANPEPPNYERRFNGYQCCMTLNERNDCLKFKWKSRWRQKKFTLISTNT